MSCRDPYAVFSKREGYHTNLHPVCWVITQQKAFIFRSLYLVGYKPDQNKGKKLYQLPIRATASLLHYHSTYSPRPHTNLVHCDAWISLSGVVEANSTTPRNARKTFATRLLNRGAAITDVQHLLGHARIKTTERAYAAFVKNDRFKKTVELLD